MAAILRELQAFVSPITARSAIRMALRRRDMTPTDLEMKGIDRSLVKAIVRCVSVYHEDDAILMTCEERLMRLSRSLERRMEPETIVIRGEEDIVRARAKAKAIAEGVGFQRTEQVKVVTAVSELARNVHQYAGGGTVRVVPHLEPPGIEIRVDDEGPGIANLDEILSGAYRSRTGLGLGLLGCKRLMDTFDVHTRPGLGTSITAHKRVA